MDADQLARAVGHTWASTGRRDLARRLALRLRQLIDADVLAAGTRLPSERSLAVALGVSRPTVTAAFDRLRSSGAVRSRRGGGTWVDVRDRAAPPAGPAMADVVLATTGINLAAAAPADLDHLDRLDLRLADMLVATPSHGHDPVGIPELRDRIAQHHAAATSGDDVVVTGGAHQALGFVLGAFVTPGDTVLVDEHTYPGLLDLLVAHRAVPVAVARDAAGTSPRALDHALRTARPALAYLTPAVHAPTGMCTPADRLDELAAVLDAHRALVVVDDTLADLRFADPVPGLAARTAEAEVMTVGSLSKSVWGGLRLGWLCAGAARRERVLRHRARVDLGTARASQQIAIAVFAQLDSILGERRATLRARRDHLLGAVDRLLPDWEVSTPDGGLTAWVALPVPDAGVLVDAAARHGVHVMDGSLASARRAHDRHVRICFDRQPELLDAGVRRLAEAWAQVDQSVVAAPVAAISSQNAT